MEFTRPKQERIVIKNEDDSIYLEGSAIDLDMLLAKSQAGIDLSDTSNVDLWVGRFQAILSESYPGIEITAQDAWVVYKATIQCMESLKKICPTVRRCRNLRYQSLRLRRRTIMALARTHSATGSP